MPKLAIITISFNTQAVLSDCLQSLHDASDITIGDNTEIIVVDNGSHDKSVEMVRNSFPDATLVETGENLGFSKGNNRGVAVVSDDVEYVLFLNSDTIVPDNTLSQMLFFMDQNPTVGVSTCKVVLPNGELDWDCHRGFPTPWVALTKLTKLNQLFPRSKLFNQYNQGWKDLESLHEIDAAVGAFMLVRRSVGDKIGWWDEDYFLNGEDIDFCYCVKEQGFSVMYVPSVSITHLRGVSKGTRKEGAQLSSAKKEGKRLVAHSSVNAMELFYRKHLQARYPVLVTWAVIGGLSILCWIRVRKWR